MIMIDHTIRAFDNDLQHLVRKIGTMACLVERQAKDAIEALLKHDSALAKSVMTSRDLLGRMPVRLSILLVWLSRQSDPLIRGKPGVRLTEPAPCSVSSVGRAAAL